MARADLSSVCEYVAARTGSALSRQQRARLEEGVAARAGDRTASVFLSHLQSLRGAAELAELMGLITVHKTDLFRDEVQLEAVKTKLLPRLLAESPRLTVWSAGCATGEEVATLLILLEEAGADARSTVLGTDLSATALAAAEPLSFGREAMRRVPPAIRDRYFRAQGEQSVLRRELAARAKWLRHNLMDRPYPLPPTGGGFDLIVCRNVLIYFTEGAWQQVVASLIDRLRPGGVLVLGAAEPLLGRSDQIQVLRDTQAFFYRKRSPDDPPPPRDSAPEWKPSASAPTPPLRSISHGSLLPVPDVDPRAEGEQLFELVLQWSAAGQPDEQTEAGLRKVLYLTPDLAPARYLLGMLAEQRGANADATSEYRRALAVLNEGKARPTPFFLNAERLKVACQQALARLGYR